MNRFLVAVCLLMVLSACGGTGAGAVNDDAGARDAGVSDGGVSDAGVIDPGADAGPSDAGPRDAGPVDGGVGCGASSCGGHGQCQVVAGQPVCACDRGWLSVGGTCRAMTSAACPLAPLPTSNELHLELDTVYSSPSGSPQRVDVAWPRVGSHHAMVLVIHGGGWRGGDKLDHRDDVLRLAGQGYVAAAINYRLMIGTQNTFPAAISDARCAVRWLRQNAARFGGDATRLLTIGASAGANSAALLAVASNVPELDDGTCALQGTPSVTGAVALFGRMDLARPPVPDYVEQLIGRTGDWQTREARASPVTHVSRGSAPLVLVHGTADTTVPPEHSRLMDAAMASAGAPSALVEVAAGHGFPLFSAQTPAVGCSTLQFLSLFVDRPVLARPVRTVIFVSKETNPGERLLLRGGHDQALDGVPMRYLNATATDTALVKAGDGWLDWYSDSALDWTTDAWRPEWGRERSYLTDGFGVDPENRWGPHHWKLDVLMDGAPGDWFEFKTVLRTSTGVTWEGDVSQGGTPAATTNHWGRKGFVTVVRFGVGAAELTPLP